jgi:mannose-6-phosphate isomerase-like protein (cupin superfamily)
VLYTGKNSQLALMCLLPGEEIGEEVHDLDQFIRFEKGRGMVIMDGVKQGVRGDDAVVIPQGTRHNVVNTGKNKPLKLYTVYSPPEHRDGTVHHKKSDEREEHFDGKTTE